MLVGNGMLKEEGSSATDSVTDVTDVTDVSPMEVGRRKREEGKQFIPTLRVCCCCQKSFVPSSHIATSNN
ncbi:hypothetical protein QUA54_22505 [Microcoleus sp. MOSTC5]|uniref:hypothetical protein n=1 Tax=Microcoleus sp. MOSTC5 TaxID=3055378 RepID=UPI002FD4E289